MIHQSKRKKVCPIESEAVQNSARLSTLGIFTLCLLIVSLFHRGYTSYGLMGYYSILGEATPVADVTKIPTLPPSTSSRPSIIPSGPPSSIPSSSGSPTVGVTRSPTDSPSTAGPTSGPTDSPTGSPNGSCVQDVELDGKCSDTCQCTSGTCSKGQGGWRCRA